MASYVNDTDFLRTLGLEDENGVQEMQELLRSSNLHNGADTLLDEPFRSQAKLWRRKRQLIQTRFSDGTFPVFYASLEIQTSEDEVKHWIVHQIPKLPDQMLYYYKFKCDFMGTVKDIRPMLPRCPDLTHPTDYAFCNELGSSSVAMKLDALLTPSARRNAGTNVPVFRRRALSNARKIEMVSVTIDYKNNAVKIKPA